MKRGTLFLLSGPSGVGKGTVRKSLFEKNKKKKNSNELIYSISATTRKPREGEVEGKDYFFIKKEKFEQLIKEDEILEYAEYVGNYYGTPKRFIEDMLEQGKDVFLEIEVQGAQQVRQKIPEAIFIFLLPPELDELKRRLEERGTESSEIIGQRVENAKKEIAMMTTYDYAVVNDNIDEAIEDIFAIVNSSKLKVSRVAEVYRNN